PTAVVTAATAWDAFPSLWPQLLDEVWAFPPAGLRRRFTAGRTQTSDRPTKPSSGGATKTNRGAPARAGRSTGTGSRTRRRRHRHPPTLRLRKRCIRTKPPRPVHLLHHADCPRPRLDGKSRRKRIFDVSQRSVVRRGGDGQVRDDRGKCTA